MINSAGKWVVRKMKHLQGVSSDRGKAADREAGVNYCKLSPPIPDYNDADDGRLIRPQRKRIPIPGELNLLIRVSEFFNGISGVDAGRVLEYYRTRQTND